MWNLFNILFVLWLLTTIPTAFAALRDIPQDVVVVVGSRVVIKCSTDLPYAVKWLRLSPGSHSATDLYHGRGVVTAPFVDRFAVGNYDLIIKSVLYEDAGEYICIDNAGFGLDNGQFASAQLTVIGKVAECQHNIVESGWFYDNGCADDASIKMACSINCTGTGEVNVTWYQDTINGESQLVYTSNQRCNASNQIASSLEVKLSEKVNLSLFTFSAQQNASESTKGLMQNITWTSPNVSLKALPAVGIIPQSNLSVKCLNENNTCKFLWRGADDQVISETNELNASSVSETNTTGNITCTAYCLLVDHKTCNKTLIVITPVAATPVDRDASTPWGMIVLTIVLCVVFITLCVMFITCCVICRKRYNGRNIILSDKISSTNKYDCESLTKNSKASLCHNSTNNASTPLMKSEANDKILVQHDSEEASLNIPAISLHTPEKHPCDGSCPCCSSKPQNFKITINNIFNCDVQQVQQATHLIDIEIKASQTNANHAEVLAEKADDNHVEYLIVPCNEPLHVVDEQNDAISTDSAIDEQHDNNDAIENDEPDEAIVRLNLQSEKENDIIGVASFLGGIYVLCRNGKKLICFKSQKPYGRDESNDIVVEQLVNPCDMVSCKIKKCLYLSDRKTRNIYKINESKNCMKLVTLPHRPALLLSIATDSDLLIIDNENRINRLNSNDGRKVQQVNLPVICERALQVAQISENHYLLNCKSNFGFTLFTIDMKQGTKNGNEKSYKSSSEEVHITVLPNNAAYVIVSCDELIVVASDLSPMSLGNSLKSLKARRSCAIDDERLLIGCSDGAYVVNISFLLDNSGNGYEGTQALKSLLRSTIQRIFRNAGTEHITPEELNRMSKYSLNTIYEELIIQVMTAIETQNNSRSSDEAVCVSGAKICCAIIHMQGDGETFSAQYLYEIFCRMFGHRSPLNRKDEERLFICLKFITELCIQLKVSQSKVFESTVEKVYSNLVKICTKQHTADAIDAVSQSVEALVYKCQEIDKRLPKELEDLLTIFGRSISRKSLTRDEDNVYRSLNQLKQPNLYNSQPL